MSLGNPRKVMFDENYNLRLLPIFSQLSVHTITGLESEPLAHSLCAQEARRPPSPLDEAMHIPSAPSYLEGNASLSFRPGPLWLSH